jgi:hypothetical protein
MENVESVQRALRAWRSTHQRGPLPASLKRRVVALCASLGADESRRSLGVRRGTVDRWLADGKAQRAVEPSPFTVVELRPEIAKPEACARAAKALRIEIATLAGPRVHIEGVFEADEIVALVRGLAG